jgi:hypothetical protein
VPYPQETDFTVVEAVAGPGWTAMSAPTNSTDPLVLKARAPEDVLAVVPYRLGFHPSDSLVVLAIDGARRRFGFTARVDLPPLADIPDVARYLLDVLKHHGVERVLLVTYADDDAVAEPLVRTLQQWLERAGIDLLDALRSDGARWYCYTCDQDCCPAEGKPYDLSGHPLVAELVLQGQVALPDRESLRGRVAPVEGARRVSMQAAFAHAHTTLTQAFAKDALGVAWVESRDSPRARMGWVRRFVGGWLAGPRALDDDEVARLAFCVASVPARDIAWSMMSRRTADLHLQLWEQVLARTVPPYEPAVACLTAFAAWLAGNGALAWCAVERALEADPEYSWADLIVQSLERAVPPTAWQPLPLEEIERFVDGGRFVDDAACSTLEWERNG